MYTPHPRRGPASSTAATDAAGSPRRDTTPPLRSRGGARERHGYRDEVTRADTPDHRSDDRLTFSVRHALHLVLAALLVTAVMRADVQGDGLVHGLGRTNAAVVVALTFLAVYTAGALATRREGDLFEARTEAPVRAATWLWLAALSVIWGAGVLVSDGFVWVGLPLYLLVLGLLPDRAGAVVVALLVALSAGLGLVHRTVSGAEATVEVWLSMVVSAGVALLGHTVFAQLRRDAIRQRSLVAELRGAQESLAVQERTTGVLTERERLAREIHDTIGQGLASIVMLSRSAEPGDREALALIESTARDNLAEARRFVRDLGRPGRVSLAESVRVMAGDAQRQSEVAGAPLRIEVAVDGNEPEGMSEEVVTALHRGVQASLANVVQHAAARSG